MGIVSIPKRKSVSPEAANTPKTDSGDWVKIAAGGALIAAGFLLLTNQRRAGMVVGAAGTALALADQQETLRSWWNQIPEYVNQVQNLIGQVQKKVDAFTARRESLHQALTGHGEGI
jgi:hypothetical protein